MESLGYVLVYLLNGRSVSSSDGTTFNGNKRPLIPIHIKCNSSLYSTTWTDIIRIQLVLVPLV